MLQTNSTQSMTYCLKAGDPLSCFRKQKKSFIMLDNNALHWILILEYWGAKFRRGGVVNREVIYC